ncbi:MAG: cell division topological specificity factor [Peptococcaceae bacterium BICA1-7]|nr:MAG: cell division topological specificity factor [Peptococcaceae bacterium BICA1-7]HBV98754.1 cell division topological specificity factor MinE [Desulfotomaculum sp.]
MLDFITRIFGRDSGASKNVAKERLRLVLVHDRSSVSPQILQDLKADLIKVISNYMEIDQDALEVNFENSENQVALIANIPIKNVKRPANVV